MKTGLVDISVVIPSYNTARTIGETLDALARQVTSLSYEVVVVDCSETDEVQAICEKSAVARVVRERQRFNPGEGRNIGARAATGQVLVFVDADVRPAPDALES